MSNKARKPLYLTRSEIFAAARRRFRSVHGAKTTPRQHPHYWAACLRMMWQAAKGDAFMLTALREDARCDSAKKIPPRRNPHGRRYSGRNEVNLIANFAA